MSYMIEQYRKHGWPVYQVTKEFRSGILKGLSVTEVTTVKFDVGVIYESCVGSGNYRVTECVEV